MSKINEKIMDVVDSVIKKSDVELYDITYSKEASRKILRILLDKKGGINLDECSSINREISNIFEENELLDDNSVVEVCSPGLDRPLRTKAHYEKSMGCDIEVNLFAPKDSKKKFSGKLLGMTEDNIVIETEEGVSVEISFKDISKAKWKI